MFCVLVLAMGSHGVAEDQAKTKVGFIYPGPISDFGYTRAHEEGRLEAQKELPWMDSSYVESVSEGDLESYIDQMVEQGIKIIFTTSTSFTEGTRAAAERYPDVLFFNTAGFERAPNMATYQVDISQSCYLEGLAAGAISKTGNIGSVSSYPTPESVRMVDSFTLGLREINPKAKVLIRWLNSWYDPPAAKEAAESLLYQGADFLISDMDSPTVAQVGEEHHIPSTGPSAYTYKAAPNSLVTSAIYDLGPVFVAILKKVRDGTYNSKNLQNKDIWFTMADASTTIFYKPNFLINPRYKDALDSTRVDDGHGSKISVYDLILKRIAQMSSTPTKFEPFTGPILDSSGKVRVPAGQFASHEQLLGISWPVAGIFGSWPTR